MHRRMKMSGTTLPDTTLSRKPETCKGSTKRKLADEDMEAQDNDNEIGLSKPEIENGVVDEEVDETRCQSQDKPESQTMEVSIQHIRQQMDLSIQQVSGMLEAGKTFFLDAMTAFEERIIHLHQKQMEKWEQKIELLRTMDAMNEDMSFRLEDARATISLLPSGIARSKG